MSSSPGGMNRRAALRLGAMAATAAGVLASTGRIAAAETSPTGWVVKASDFGFDSLDSTSALQAALDAAADTVVIDDVGADWITRPLFLRRSNVTLIIAPGVTVRAKPGGYPNLGDSLLAVDGQTGVRIIGYGATIAMNKPEYTTGQWRMGIRIRSTVDMTVEGLTIRDTGGDGIYLGVAPGYANYCKNTVIRDVTCDNNRRNGLSVISVDGLLIERSAFTNTIGNQPEGGIDFEPNYPTELLTNIVVRDCVFEGNNTHGLLFYLAKLNSTSTPVDIVVERCFIGPQHGPIPTVRITGPVGTDAGGTIELRDCLVQTAPGSGSLGVFEKKANGTQLKLVRTVWWNLGNIYERYPPFAFMGGGLVPLSDSYGGAEWIDNLLITDQQTPFLQAVREKEGTGGLANLRGNVTVVNPNGVTVDWGMNPHDNDLDVVALSAPAPTTVSVRADRSTVAAGLSAQLIFTRESDDVSAPLAVAFHVGGTAVERFDYAGLSTFALIPPGERSVSVPLITRRVPQSRGRRTIVVVVDRHVSYSVSGASVEVTVQAR